MSTYNRVSSTQLEILVSFMEGHGDLSKPGDDGAHGRLTNAQTWMTLIAALNSDPTGCKKTEEKWRRTWSDLKSNVKRKAAKIREYTRTRGGPACTLKLTNLDKRVLVIIKSAAGMSGVQDYMRAGKQPPAGNKGGESKRKNSKFFAYIKKNCVDLVKRHGRPLELIDDAAFQNILKVVPITDDERMQLTAKFIEELINIDGDDDDTTYDEDYVLPGNTERSTVKSEVVQCTCAYKDDDEEEQRHELDCPAVANQAYWNFFEMSIEEGKCNICNKIIKWVNMTDLKDHLNEDHPGLKYKDDDEEFEKGPPSESEHLADESHTDEIYLEGDIFEDTTIKEISVPILSKSEPKTKKRRFSEKPRARDHNQDKPQLPDYRHYRDSLPDVKLKDSEIISLDKFSCLDRFGLYVAALMRALPKDKCIKYQEHIVQRLLKEQAAAG